MPRRHSVPIFLREHGLFAAGERIPDNIVTPEVAERFRLPGDAQRDDATSRRREVSERDEASSDT
ncbi:MAG TPA: hypothetical protein VIT91_21525 [Chthoniobacterales bacterium]